LECEKCEKMINIIRTLRNKGASHPSYADCVNKMSKFHEEEKF